VTHTIQHGLRDLAVEKEAGRQFELDADQPWGTATDTETEYYRRAATVAIASIAPMFEEAIADTDQRRISAELDYDLLLAVFPQKTPPLTADEAAIARRFGLDTNHTLPPVDTVRLGETRTITGQVFSASIRDEGPEEDRKLLPNGEYLVGLHVRPNA